VEDKQITEKEIAELSKKYENNTCMPEELWMVEYWYQTLLKENELEQAIVNKAALEKDM
jgi:hypothetical protein